MILITLSTFLAVIVINTHIRGDRKNRVPNWLRRVSFSLALYTHVQGEAGTAAGGMGHNSPKSNAFGP